MIDECLSLKTTHNKLFLKRRTRATMKICVVRYASDPRGLGHIVAGILRVLDRTTASWIPLATVGASKRLPSDTYIKYSVCYARLS